MASFYEVTAHADSHPLLPFKASVDRSGEALSDDYVSRRVCERISEQVSSNLSGLSCAYYVHTGIMSGDSLCPDPEVSIEEFNSVWEPYNRYYIYVHLSGRSLDARQAGCALIRAITELPALSGNITVYISNDTEINNVRKYVETSTGIYDDYAKLTDPYLCGQYMFTNGVFSVSADDIEKDISVFSRSK